MVPRVGEWPMHDRSAHATHTGCSDWLRDRHVCGLSQASGGRCWAFGGHAGSDPSSRREWRPVGRHTTLTPRWCLHTARLAAGFRVPGASTFLHRRSRFKSDPFKYNWKNLHRPLGFCFYPLLSLGLTFDSLPSPQKTVVNGLLWKMFSCFRFQVGCSLSPPPFLIPYPVLGGDGGLCDSENP